MKNALTLLLLLCTVVGFASKANTSKDQESILDALFDRDYVALSDLISEGADPNERLHNGAFPLHLAVFTGSREGAAILLAGGADPNAIDFYGASPLGVAIERNVPDIGLLLLDNGADPVLAATGRVKSPVITLVWEFKTKRDPAYVELLSILLNRGISPNEDDGDISAIKIALENGLDEMLVLLVCSGATGGKREIINDMYEEVIVEKGHYSYTVEFKSISNLRNYKKEIICE